MMVQVKTQTKTKGDRERGRKTVLLMGKLKTYKLMRKLQGIPTTLISLTKNLVYKNIEAQIRKKIRTMVKTLPASRTKEFKNI